MVALFNKVHTKSNLTDGTKAAVNFRTAPLLILRASTADSATASLYELATGTSHVQLVTSGVDSAALTSDGALYVTRPTGQEAGSCDLYAGSTDKVVLSWQDVSVPVDRLRGLCEISSDGAGGVLFEADDGTIASNVVWDFSPGTQRVSFVADGLSPTAAEGGTPTATMYHGYYAAGGSYDIPYAGPLGGPQRPLVAVPAQAAEEDWEAPALSWNGRLFAAELFKGQSVSVVLAHLSSPSDSVTGAITTLWRLPADWYVGQLFFGADGVLYGVVDNSRLGLGPAASSLYRIALSGSGPTLVAKDVDMIVSAGQAIVAPPSGNRPNVTLRARYVGPLEIGVATMSKVRSLEGAPSRVFVASASGAPPGGSPVNFSGSLWQYDCGFGCYSLYGFTGQVLKAFGSTDPTLVAFGRVRVGSSLAVAKSVPGAAFSGLEVQCPGVNYPAPKGYQFIALVQSAKVYYWYQAAPVAGFSACGS
jgi:hypothetical protein